MAIPVDRWKWLQLLASQHGPPHPTTRHVLMTISLHMKQYGGDAWPSQKLIALRSGLSERAVRTHVEKARRDHWLIVFTKGMTGKAWRHYEYVAAIPDHLENVSPSHPWETDPSWKGAERPSAPTRHEQNRQNGQGAATGAQGAERSAEGAANDDTKVRNDVPTNLQSESTKNQSGEGALKCTTRAVDSSKKDQIGRSLKPPHSLKQITDEQLWKKIQRFEQVGVCEVSSVIKQLGGSFQDINQERIWSVLRANGRTRYEERATP